MFGCSDRLEGLMHSSMLQELALKCERSGNVSNLQNVFHSYFGGRVVCLWVFLWVGSEVDLIFFGI